MKCIWLRQDEIEKPEVEVAQEEKPQASVVGSSRPAILWSVSLLPWRCVWCFGSLENQSYLFHLSFYVSIFLFVCLPVYQFTHLIYSIYLSIDPSIYQSISLSINLPIYLSTYLSMYLSNLILFDPI